METVQVQVPTPTPLRKHGKHVFAGYTKSKSFVESRARRKMAKMRRRNRT